MRGVAFVVVVGAAFAVVEGAVVVVGALVLAGAVMVADAVVVEVTSLELSACELERSEFDLFALLAIEIPPTRSPIAKMIAVATVFDLVDHDLFTQTSAIPIGQQQIQATITTARCSNHFGPGWDEPVGALDAPLGGAGGTFASLPD